MSKYLLYLLLVFMFIPAGVADNKRKAITILAPITCVQWIEGRKADQQVEPLSFNHAGMRNKFWLLGLVTGLNANFDQSNLLDSVDSDLIFDWMDAYCGHNQDADVFDGANELLLQISRKLKR